MKLGSKILLGFIITNIIFFALSMVVIYLVLPVQKSMDELKGAFLTTINKAATVQYNIGVIMSMQTAYGLSGDDELWATGQASHDIITQFSNELKNDIAASPSLNVPKFTNALNDLLSRYAEYTQYAAVLPDIMAKILGPLENIDLANTAIMENSRNYIKSQEELTKTADGLAHLHLDRIQQMLEIVYLSDVVIGLSNKIYLNDEPELFATIYQNIEQLKSMIQQLAADETQGGAETKKQLEAISAAIETFAGEVPVFDKAVTAKLANDEARASIFPILRQLAIELKESAIHISEERASSSTAALQFVVWSLVVGLAIALLVSLFMAFFITKSITSPISRLIEVLSASSASVDRVTEKLSVTSNALSEMAHKNASSLSDTSSAMEELSSMTQNNSENSAHANSLMSEAISGVKKADESMSGVTKAMEEISISGNEISKIIKTIDDIAFQTNLLALNASVEAARAGEAGAGFAVVADEVRNLASRSAEAAKNTASLIESTINNINSGSQLVKMTAENFKTLEEHSNKVAELLSEVASASREQAQGIVQVNSSVTVLDTNTQSNSNSANEAAEAVGQLSQQTTQLLDSIGQLSMLVYGRSNGYLSSANPSSGAPKKHSAPKALPARVESMTLKEKNGRSLASPVPQKVSKAQESIPFDDGFDDF